MPSVKASIQTRTANESPRPSPSFSFEAYPSPRPEPRHILEPENDEQDRAPYEPPCHDLRSPAYAFLSLSRGHSEQRPSPSQQQPTSPSTPRSRHHAAAPSLEQPPTHLEVTEL
ncbi:hypothetical protein F2Q68_00003666 [Brassica cretica]|uniref:Uncharacterized protein n=2 Tax=Brassica cretica TaxID=69181 RepID=A0ABQ7C386_BRACR|nr:hypothetical protein F2Q68_00003666 [Brassica cretica]KAF3546136.1 hypothetical protein DY000_02005332 [Brassica cretica]